MFVAARRAHFPAMEARGALLPEDVGGPVPLLPELFAQAEAIARKHDVEIPVVAHAGEGNTHPIVVYPPGDTAVEVRARAAFEDVMALTRRIKDALDPAGILNPGAVL